MMSAAEKFGYPDPQPEERDETGTFAIRTVYLDGVERLTPDIPSLREALMQVDAHRKHLAGLGYDRTRVHVDVIDLDDGERRLDWETLDPD